MNERQNHRQDMTKNIKNNTIYFLGSMDALPCSISYAGYIIYCGMSCSKTNIVYYSRYNIKSYLLSTINGIGNDKKQKRMI